MILKLATYDLFNNTLQSLDIEENKLKILDTFKYKFDQPIKRKRRKKANNSEKYDLQKALVIVNQPQKMKSKKV